MRSKIPKALRVAALQIEAIPVTIFNALQNRRMKNRRKYQMLNCCGNLVVKLGLAPLLSLVAKSGKTCHFVSK